MRLTEIDHAKVQHRESVTPFVGQSWTHKQYGGNYTVVERAGGKVIIENVDAADRKLKLYEVQLIEHYAPLD